MTLSTLIAVVLVFAILLGIYLAAGRFGSPTGQKITGVVCLILFVLYALSRLGFLDVGQIKL